MQYLTFNLEEEFTKTSKSYILVSFGEYEAKTFPVDGNNPDYVQFLINAQLTETEVQALTPDVWYDFPA